MIATMAAIAGCDGGALDLSSVSRIPPFQILLCFRLKVLLVIHRQIVAASNYQPPTLLLSLALLSKLKVMKAKNIDKESPAIVFQSVSVISKC